MASTISNPSIIIVSHLRDGSVVTVGDYQAAYWWFRDTTPEDARDLSWWDYKWMYIIMFDESSHATELNNDLSFDDAIDNEEKLKLWRLLTTYGIALLKKGRYDQSWVTNWEWI